MSAPFVHPVTVRFSQVDAAGILYFSRAHELCHEAFEAFLATRGTPMSPAMFTAPEWVLPIVHAEADFVAPMRLGDPIAVHVGIERVGRASVTVGFRLVGTDGAVRAIVRHVHTSVDPATFTACELPDAVRAWGTIGSVLGEAP